MKVCTICHIEKGLDEFHLCKKGKMNRKSKCKECVKSETKEYYQKNIDYYKNLIIFNLGISEVFLCQYNSISINSQKPFQNRLIFLNRSIIIL